MAAQLSPAANLINQKERLFPLNLSQTTNFLSETFKKSNISEIALKYTQDTQLLINMLSSIQDQPIENKLKHRISRIKKKLQAHLNGDSSDSQSVDGKN